MRGEGAPRETIAKDTRTRRGGISRRRARVRTSTHARRVSPRTRIKCNRENAHGYTCAQRR
jgi:hypothetical protein